MGPWRTAGLGLLFTGAAVALVWPRPVQRNYPDREPVVFWHPWGAEWRPVVDRIVKGFNESQTEYDMSALSIPQGATTKAIISVAGGRPPDVMAQWDAVVPTWAGKGIIQPLDTLMTPAERAAFATDAYPCVRRMSMVKGRIYTAVPGTNQFAIYVRTDHLKEAGLDPDKFPSTLQGLRAWARKLDRRDARGEYTRMGFAPDSWRALAPAFGGGFWDWAKGGLTLDRPENLEALKFIEGERERVGQDRYVRFQAGNAADSGGAWAFISGRLSMCIDGQWRVEQIGKYRPELPYRIYPIPPAVVGGPRLAGFTGGNQMVIPSGARSPKGAMAFIRYWTGMTRPDRAAPHVTAGGWLPMYRTVTNAQAYQAYLKKYPQFRVFVELMASENVTPLPPVPYQQLIQDRMNAAQDRVLRGSMGAQASMRQFIADVEHEQKRRREMRYDE